MLGPRRGLKGRGGQRGLFSPQPPRPVDGLVLPRVAPHLLGLPEAAGSTALLAHVVGPAAAAAAADVDHLVRPLAK